MPKRFTLTNDHILLLRRANVGWQNCETGAPEIDPKRPYGDSSVAQNVMEILGWERRIDDNEWPDEEQEEQALKIHRETETALQIILETASFRPGIYEDSGKYYTPEWNWISEA